MKPFQLLFSQLTSFPQPPPLSHHLKNFFMTPPSEIFYDPPLVAPKSLLTYEPNYAICTWLNKTAWRAICFKLPYDLTMTLKLKANKKKVCFWRQKWQIV